MKARNILTALMLLFVCAGTCTIISSCSKDDTEENGPSGNNSGSNSSENTGENLDIVVTVTDEGITPKGTVFTAVDDNTFFVNYIKYTVKEGHLAVSGYDETGLKSINGAAKIVSKIIYKGIPYQVLEIGEEAFYRCNDLTSVTIPESVTSFGDYAFSRCTGLTSITIPNSVTNISKGCFSDCSNLISINIPNGVTKIDSYTFSGCSSLMSINIPSGLTDIGYDAFYGCSSLTAVHINDLTAWCDIQFYKAYDRIHYPTITNSNPLRYAHHLYLNGEEIKDLIIPNSVTRIGGNAFLQCSGLTSITIPNSVTSIGSEAFRGCSGVTSIKVEEGNTKYDSRDNCNAIIETSTCKLVAGCKNTIIPISVTSFGDYAFSGCTSLTSITIPNSVTNISKGCFSGCSNLISITIPESVKSIGNNAFSDCSNISSIIIGSGVKSIEYYTFSGCTSLTSITIGSGVTSIGEDAFRSCSSLTDLYCYAVRPSTSNYAFENTPISSVTLHVPAGFVNFYKAAEPWKFFKSIVAIE